MGNYFKKKISLISFLFIPIVYFWDPNWLEFLGVQPYWPLFWLLPWSMIYGSFNGSIIGLFLGLILDSLSLDSSFTQIPGLVLCGIWFGKLGISNNVFIGHFRVGLVCSVASFFCGLLYFFQIDPCSDLSHCHIRHINLCIKYIHYLLFSQILFFRNF